MGFSLPYSPDHYGLEKQADGTWIYRKKWAYPGSIFFRPHGKAYRLAPKAGRAADNAIEKLGKSKLIIYLVCFSAFWFLITGFPISGRIFEFMQMHRYQQFIVVSCILVMRQNYYLNRIAKFCQKVGTPISKDKI